MISVIVPVWRDLSPAVDCVMRFRLAKMPRGIIRDDEKDIGLPRGGDMHRGQQQKGEGTEGAFHGGAGKSRRMSVVGYQPLLRESAAARKTILPPGGCSLR